MAVKQGRKEERTGAMPAVFDSAHLARAAMEDQALAREVLGLFLVQLPALLQSLDEAGTPEDWAFATHSLKGAAALVGAQKLSSLAADLEGQGWPVPQAARRRGLAAIEAAAAEFRAAARTVVFAPPFT